MAARENLCLNRVTDIYWNLPIAYVLKGVVLTDLLCSFILGGDWKSQMNIKLI